MSNATYQVPLERTANDPVPEGVHLFTVSSFDEGEGPKGPYWKFVLSCNTPGQEGKQVTHIVSLAPAARWRLELFLDAMGAPKSGFVTADKFIGRKFRAQVKHEDYEGRAQARIGEMYAVNSSNVPAAAPNQNAAVKKATAAPKIEQQEKPAVSLPSDVANEDQVPNFS
jgi:hypothetical protein